MSAGPRLDLHVHSRHSPDSRLELRAAADQLGPSGLQGFALTDHNTVAGHATVRELRERFPRAWFVNGVEVSTLEGHLLIYGVDEAPPRDRSASETIAWAEARSGVAVLAHPYRWVHGVGDRAARALRVVGLESRNGRSSETANMRAELVAARRNLAMVGGSDAHEVESMGRAFTEFPEEPGSVEDLLEALRHHRTAAGGRSLSVRGRLWLAARNGMLRATRGFHPI